MKEDKERGVAGQDEFAEDKRRDLEEKLHELGIGAQIEDIHVGPVVSLFEIRLQKGAKLKQIEGAMNDLSLAMGTPSVRYLGILPGKGLVGIEVPNLEQSVISLREILGSSVTNKGKGSLEVPFGVTIAGEPYFADIVKMPHLLIAGTTGSGKSVFVHSLIVSLLSRYSPEHLRLLLIDPKFVEFSVYDRIAHVLHPTINESQEARDGLDWLIHEMESRYQFLASVKARNIEEYNSGGSRKKLMFIRSALKV